MLSDAQIRKAKAKDKPYKVFDSGGLFVLVKPSGSKLWRMKFKIGGKEKLLSFGPYPEITLAEARERRDGARRLLRDGRDPTQEKARAFGAAQNTFENVARAWHRAQKAKWSSDHADRVINSFEKDVFPSIGNLDIKDITAPLALSVVRKVEERSAMETAGRIRQRMSGVFVYGIASGLCENDPAAIIKKAMAHSQKTSLPAITDLEGVRRVLRDAEAIPAHPVTKLGLRLLALTAVRSTELRGATWFEFEGLEGESPLWRIPKERMKGGKREHVVTLSRQAVDAINVLRSLTGTFPYVLPNGRNPRKLMSENAFGYLLNRAGYFQRHVPHGWRSSFSSVMNEAFPADQQIIDRMLAHVVKDKVEAAYNRSVHMDRRRELSQIWADMLTGGMPPAITLVDGARR